MAFIIHHHNGEPVSHIAFDQALTIGRDDGNDLQMDDATVSGFHADIRRGEQGTYTLRDLGSTNGVLFKGEPVVEQVLVDGDYFMVGTSDLQFVLALPEQLQRTARIKKSWIPGIFYTSK